MLRRTMSLGTIVSPLDNDFYHIAHCPKPDDASTVAAHSSSQLYSKASFEDETYTKRLGEDRELGKRLPTKNQTPSPPKAGSDLLFDSLTVKSRIHRRTLQPSLQVLRTRDMHRPSTAPTTSGTFPTPSGFDALITDTAHSRSSGKLKRSFSEADSTSFDASLSSSRPSQDSKMDGRFPSLGLESLRGSERAKRRKLERVYDELYEAPVQRHKENVEEAAEILSSRVYQSFASSQQALLNPTLLVSDTHPRTRSAPPEKEIPKSVPFFIPFRDYDWTTSPSSSDDDESTVDEDDSTASASQTPQERTSTTQPYFQRLTPDPTRWQQFTPIDLTSSVSIIAPAPEAVIASLGTSISVPETSSSHSDPPDPTPQMSVIESLRTLPAELFPPPPPTGNRIFASQVTPMLKLITDQAPLAKYFRPVSITRDLHGTERGYWALSLRLVADSDTRAEADVDVDVWRRSDFDDLYESLQKHITTGRSGWSVRAFLELPSFPAVITSRSNYVYVNVKITCYAEVLPHIWLTIWVFSHKKTGRLGMQWHASDDRVVVQMGRDGRKGDVQGGDAKKLPKIFVGTVAWGSKEQGMYGAVAG